MKPRDLRAEYVAAVTAPVVCAIVAAWLAGSMSLGAGPLVQFLCAAACLTAVILTGAAAWKIADENTVLYRMIEWLRQQQEGEHDAD